MQGLFAVEPNQNKQNIMTKDTRTLYHRLLDAGIKTDNHYSDLHFPSTSTTRRIISESLRDGVIPNVPVAFTSELDGGVWYEAAFEYQPFWNRKMYPNIRPD